MNFVVAYDDSDGARQALRGVTPLARAAGATLVLVRILDPRIDAKDVPAETNSQAMAIVERRSQEQMKDAAIGTGVEARVRVVTVERGEDVSEALIRTAQEERADLIAIGSRRAGGLSGVLLGSVAQAVVRDAPCPAFIVRAT